MIIHWTKYEKGNAKQSLKENESKENDQSKAIQIEKSLNDKEDYQQDHLTSSTYAASKLNFFDSKDPKSVTELNISSISSIANEEDSRIDLFSQIDLSSDMPVSVGNNNNGNNNYYLSEYFQQNFPKVIKNQIEFNWLLNYYETNPTVFIQNFFSLLVFYGAEMSLSPISHSLIMKSMPYYSSFQCELFYFKVIKKNCNLISCNQYGAKVLNQFIINNSTTSLNHHHTPILIDLTEAIKANIVLFVSNCNSLTILETLLTSNINNYVSNTIIDAILSNTIQIALGVNGSNVITVLISSFSFKHSIIQVLLNNIGIILIHTNGYLIIELLFCLNSPQIDLFVSRSILSNLPYLLNKGSYLNLLEKWIPFFDKAIRAKITPLLYNEHILPHSRGNKLKGKTTESPAENILSYLKSHPFPIRKQQAN